MNRRNTIKSLAATTAALALSPKSSFAASRKFRFKLVTTWSPQLPVLQEAADLFAKIVKEASQGELEISVYAGGELIPAMGVFDAVSQGVVHMGVGSPYYWAGKCRTLQFFGSMPFGMNATQFRSWIMAGDGQKLWEETYAQFNIQPFSFGNTGVQMGGWFRKEIHSMADLQGLKMRIPGIGGKVMAEAGANVVLLSGAEVYTALERGTIDATEWISPYHDERMGLYRAAKIYYYPGWQEPQSNLELTVNKRYWEKLPTHLQQIVRTASEYCNSWTMSKLEAENGASLIRLTEKHGVRLLEYPADVLNKLSEITKEVVSEIGNADPLSKKVYENYLGFKKSADGWSEISDKAMAKV